MYEEILAIRKDEYARNRFIEKYKPFLAKYTSTVAGRYVSYGIDDELSIALLAFNESIDRYNGEGIFFEYAKMVVKSRLLDYFKSKEYKEKHDSIDEDQYLLNQGSKKQYIEEIRVQRLKEEVEELKKVLKYYNIEILDLHKQSPKHFLTKQHVDHILSLILQNNEIVSLIIDKGYLPMNLILEQYKTSRKKLEPYRKYIITVVIICVGQFELLKDYMPGKVIQS
ncbi:MAG: RNA polymerase subunit sigma [Bacilli bacterium]|nr:RNA polymerase subunit sigma [Bacilli bacterium]